MKRSEAREALLVLLYEMSFNPAEELEDTILKEKDNRDLDDPYLIDAVHGIYEHLSEIDEKIGAKIHGWRLNRLSRISHAILRISVYEMLYADIPFGTWVVSVFCFPLLFAIDCSSFPACVGQIRVGRLSHRALIVPRATLMKIPPFFSPEKTGRI